MNFLNLLLYNIQENTKADKMNEIGPQFVIQKIVTFDQPKANSAEFDIGPQVFQIMFCVNAMKLNRSKMYLNTTDKENRPPW